MQAHAQTAEAIKGLAENMAKPRSSRVVRGADGKVVGVESA